MFANISMRDLVRSQVPTETNMNMTVLWDGVRFP
jgi:hypothetical protein